MKEGLNKDFIDLRRFDQQIDSIELIKQITNKQENDQQDAFYIVDLEDICQKHVNWITKLPRVEPHYAIKCNTDPMLLRTLAYLGASFDCASKNEIQQVLDIGVSSDRIIFANPCKQASFIRYAYKAGVDLMTFDNENELHKIKANHPQAKCVLRIMTNDADAVCRFSMKFGADMETSLKLIATAVELDLDLVGISFHVGSGQMSPKAFAESIENARTLFDYAREQFGVRMHLLDLGGGYPGSSDSEDLFDSIACEINRSLEQHFNVAEFDDLKVIAEPGRYYACSAYTLCTNVIAKRVMPQNKAQQDEYLKQLQQPSELVDASKSIMYYINDGVYHSFNCLFYDHAVVTPILLGEQKETVYKSSIWGPTCDGLDCVVKEMLLPELPQGDFMAWRDMGAYTISGAVAFNGIPVPKCIYTVSHSWDIIKQAYMDMHDEPIVMALFDETRVNTMPTQAEIHMAHPASSSMLLCDDTQSVLSDGSCDSGLSSNPSEVALSSLVDNLFTTSCAEEVVDDAISMSRHVAPQVTFI
jgi:ornithine decarboxylase